MIIIFGWRDILDDFPRSDISYFLFITVSSAVRRPHPPSASVVRIRTLQSPDLHVVERIAPDVLILEIGTNDLVDTSPEVVGSEIENLVRLLLGHYKVRIVCVCRVIPRGHSYDHAASFARCVEILQHYLDIVLSVIPNVFCWVHRAFSHPGKKFYLPDGVHVNPAGHYHLYRSYRGAIFRALRLL